MRDEYQGWTNYETYAVSIEIDNNQGYWLQRAAELLDDPLDGVGTAYEALLQGAINLVAWDELAAHLIGKVQEVAANVQGD